MIPYNKSNIPLAKDLRKNMTPWERKLWYDFLRIYPVRFQRQKALGKFGLCRRRKRDSHHDDGRQRHCECKGSACRHQQGNGTENHDLTALGRERSIV